MADILKIAKRYRWLFFAAVVGTCLPLALIIFFIPNQYESTASVLVESQRVPEDLVRPTITGVVEERIQSVQHTVLTRSNVLELVRKLNVYPDMVDANPTRIVNRFLNSTTISLSRSGSGRRTGGTTAFDLTFSSGNPATAQRVAGELVTLFLNENARSRTARATETTDFLSEEGLKVKEKVQRLEAKISEFKQIHRVSMPEMFEMNMSLFERAKREDQTLAIDIAGLRSELRQLQLQRATVSSGGNSVQSVTELRQSYNQFLINNYPEHPTAIAMLRNIEAIEKASLDIEPSEESVIAQPTSALDLQTQTANEKLQFLLKSQSELDTQIAELENRISQTPIVEQQYVELRRDMEAMQLNYQDIKNKESEARIAQHLESGLKGERFSLLEPPVVPDLPSTPNRLQLLLMAFAGSLAVGVGSVFLLQLIRKNLYSATTFENALGFAPLVELPYIELAEESELASKRMKLGIAGSTAVAASLLGAIHFFYLSLDEVWVRLLNGLAVG